MSKLFAEVVASQTDLATRFGIRLEAHATVAQINGDAFLLVQALVNLTKNAIEHAEKGSSVVLAGAGGDREFELSVTNQGPPIPGYALEHIFERFYSLPNSQGKKGSGIGLSFVHEIAKLHGGHVRIENLVADGVKATLTV